MVAGCVVSDPRAAVAAIVCQLVASTALLVDLAGSGVSVRSAAVVQFAWAVLCVAQFRRDRVLRGWLAFLLGYGRSRSMGWPTLERLALPPDLTSDRPRSRFRYVSFVEWVEASI